MSPTRWDADRTREQMLRRRARTRGLIFAKVYGHPCWVLFDKNDPAGAARIFYDLDAATEALPLDRPPAG